MLTVQIYRPDTCGCQFFEAFDDEDQTIEPFAVTREEVLGILAARRAAKPLTTTSESPPVLRDCPVHTEPDVKLRHAVMREENRRKNSAVSEVAKLAGIDPGDVTWVMEADRSVTVGIRDRAFTGPERATLTQTLRDKHGAGRVNLR